MCITTISGHCYYNDIYTSIGVAIRVEEGVFDISCNPGILLAGFYDMLQRGGSALGKS